MVWIAVCCISISNFITPEHNLNGKKCKLQLTAQLYCIIALDNEHEPSKCQT